MTKRRTRFRMRGFGTDDFINRALPAISTPQLLTEGIKRSGIKKSQSQNRNPPRPHPETQPASRGPRLYIQFHTLQISKISALCPKYTLNREL